MSGISGPPRKEPHLPPAWFELAREDFLETLHPELRKQILRDDERTPHARTVEVFQTIATQAMGKQRRGAA